MKQLSNYLSSSRAVAVLFVVAVPLISAADKNKGPDLEATVHQSTVNKVLDSIPYPYTAFDAPVDADWKCLTREETAHIIQTLNRKARTAYTDEESQIAALISESRDATDRVIRYIQSGKPLDGAPPIEDLIAKREFLEGKRSTVPLSVRGCCYLAYKISRAKLDITERPNIWLGHSKINLQNVEVYAKAWIRWKTDVDWICCGCFWCTCPHHCCHTLLGGELRPSSAGIASGYVRPQQVAINGKQEIAFFGHVDSLHLNNGNIWDIFPLEEFVNPSLKNKPLAAIPLSEFVVDVTPIDRRIAVTSIQFIDAPNSLPISITVDVQSGSHFRLFGR